MTTEKHKTVLEIGVEDRMLRRFGDTIKRVFSTEPIDRHRRAQESVTKELEKQRRVGERLARQSGGGQRDARGRFVAGGGSGGGGAGGAPGRAPVGGGGAGGGRGLGFAGTAAATGVGFMGGQAMGRGMGAMRALGGGTGATAAALGAVPFVGPALQAVVQAAEGLADKAIGASQARAGAMGQTGIGNFGGMGLSKYGISQMQAPGRLAGLAQQSGFRGNQLKNFAAPKKGMGAIGIEAFTGISGAGLAGAAGTSGGVAGPKQSLRLIAQAIGAGMDAGFRDAKLGSFIQEIASSVEGMRKRGIMISPASMPMMTRMFGMTKRKGLQGEAGAHAATSMKEAMAGAADRGDYYGALMMSTASDEGMDHYEAMQALEGDEGTLKKFGLTHAELASKILNRLGGTKGNVKGKAMALKQLMPGLSYTAARAMAEEVEGGGGFTTEGFEGAQNQGEGYIGTQKKSFGLAGEAASLEDSQIAGGNRGVTVGGEKTTVAGSVMGMRRRETKMAAQGAVVGAKVADFTSKIVERYGKALASKNPFTAVMKLFAEDLKKAFSAVVGAIKKELDAAFDKNKDKLAQQLGFKDAEELGKKFIAISEGLDKFGTALSTVLAIMGIGSGKTPKEQHDEEDRAANLLAKKEAAARAAAARKAKKLKPSVEP